MSARSSSSCSRSVTKTRNRSRRSMLRADRLLVNPFTAHRRLQAGTHARRFSGNVNGRVRPRQKLKRGKSLQVEASGDCQTNPRLISAKREFQDRSIHAVDFMPVNAALRQRSLGGSDNISLRVRRRSFVRRSGEQSTGRRRQRIMIARIGLSVLRRGYEWLCGRRTGVCRFALRVAAAG